MGIDDLHFSLDCFQKARDIHPSSGKRSLEFGATQNGFQFRRVSGLMTTGMRRRCKDGLKDPGRRPCGGQQAGTRKYWYQNDAHARADRCNLSGNLFGVTPSSRVARRAC